MTPINFAATRTLERVVLGVAVALCASGIALAQNAPASDEGASAEISGGLKEIVVTATRHEESLSKVPVSVSAYTQEDMDQKGMKDFSDIVRFTPGVSIDQTGTNAISIRGISSSGGAGTTGIYIDDTPIQMRSLGFNPDDTLPKTFDLDRVEVLRGPQGTLFGAGSEGGTVRYILTQPSVTKESTYARSEVSFTQYGEPSYEAGVAHGGPIIDGTLGFRASAWFRRDGGWIDRVDPTSGAVVDSNANHAQTLVLRLAGMWKPLDTVTVTPSVFYQNRQEHDVSTYWPSSSNPSAGVFNNANPDRIPVPDRFYLPALKIEADLGSTRLVSNTSYYVRDEITGYEGTDYNLSYYQGIGWPNSPEAAAVSSGSVILNQTLYPLIDSAGVHLPPGLTNYRAPASVKNQQRSFTEELRLQSNDPTSRWTWTVGAFLQASRELSVEEIHDPMGDALLTALVGNDFLGIYGVPLLPNGDAFYERSVAHDHQLAGFGEVTYGITEQLKLTLGARVAKTSFDISSFSNGPQNYGPSPGGPGSAYQSETPFTPKVGVSYQLNQSHLFYATYAKGFRVGGANPPLPTYCQTDVMNLGYPSGQAPLTYKSDSTNSYEIGAKNNFNNVFKLASSVYYIRWTDIQQSVFVPGSCGLQFTDNLGTAVAKGFDLQAEAALGPVALEAAVGYTSARYVADSKNNLALDGDAISGQAAINGAPGTNPPWNVSLGAQYNFVLANHSSYARFDYEFTSRNPWLATIQDPNSSQYGGGDSTPLSYTLSSTSFLQFRTGTTFGAWQTSFFIDNLLNSQTTTNYERTFIDSNNPNPPPGPQYNNYTFRPRTFGVTVTFRD
jgi:iron complex outermembrane receptor protein